MPLTPNSTVSKISSTDFSPFLKKSKTSEPPQRLFNKSAAKTFSVCQMVTTLSMHSMVSTLQHMAVCQLTIDKAHQKKIMIALASFLIGSLFLLCIFLQTSKSPKRQKDLETIYNNILGLIAFYLKQKYCFLKTESIDSSSSLLG